MRIWQVTIHTPREGDAFFVVADEIWEAARQALNAFVVEHDDEISSLSVVPARGQFVVPMGGECRRLE